jgi:hypothetical protein
MSILTCRGFTIEYEFNKDNIHIENSSIIRSVSDMKAILNLITTKAARRNIFYKRKMSSWIREWKAHNVLCDHNYQSHRTGSVDLSETESLFRRIGYFILSLFYKEN